MIRWCVLVLRSFGPALAGLGWALRTQRNLQVHALAATAALILGFLLKLERWEWCAVLLACAAVWTAELLNTAVEVLADRVSLQREEAIRRCKDVAAAAVLVTALMALAVGAVVFLPKVWQLL